MNTTFQLEDLALTVRENRLEAIFLVSEEGVVLCCSDVASALFGFDSPDELEGLAVIDLVPADFATLFPDRISQEHLTKGKYLKRVNKRKSGELFPTLVRTDSVTVGERKYVITRVMEDHDISDSLNERLLAQNVEVLKCEVRKLKNTVMPQTDGYTLDLALKKKLHRLGTNMTDTDLRLANLLYLNLNSHDIARELGIALNSVYVARKRLRKKLGIPKDMNIQDFIATIDLELEEGKA